MVIHFIQNVSLDNGFPETRFKRISEFNSPSSRNLYKGLLTAVYEYQKKSHGRRDGKRYAGRTIGELEGMLQRLQDGRFDLDTGVRGGLHEHAFGSASTMVRPRRMASDLVAEHDPSAPWPDVEDWISERDNSSGVCEHAPEELAGDVSTSVILALCRDQLKEALTRATRGSAIRGVIACVHIDTRKPQHSKKQRKVNEAQSTLVLNLDYQASSVFREGILVNSLVWLMPRSELTEFIARQQFKKLFDAGSLRLLTGHSSDHRRVNVKPPILFTGDVKREDCICVLLADVHPYVFLFECFKATNSNLTRTHEQVHLLQAATNNILDAPSVLAVNNDVRDLHGSLFKRSLVYF